MDRRYISLAVLEFLTITLPLAVVLYLVLPSTDDVDFGYILWGMFSAAAAGLVPLLLRASRPALASRAPGLDDARLDRLARVAFFATFCLLLPLWLVVFDPVPTWTVLARVMSVPAFAALALLLARFLSLPAYWRLYRDHATEAGWDFIGSELDLRTRPAYYDQDIAWLLALLRKRLTSASS